MSGIVQPLAAGDKNYVINGQTMNASDIEISPTNAVAGIFIDAAGAVNLNSIGSDFNLITYGAPSELEINFTLSVGTLTSGTTGSWLALGVPLSWTRNRTSIGTNTASGTYSVRVAATGQVLVSGVAWSLTATVDT